MNRAYGILPCYTGDVSGVCSALYELGGMVVIHDPSGCNSTYNTHDETRWYSQDSLIFISGLSEMDAILGSDEKLVREISEAALSLSPRFIALASSPIPYLSGQDMPALGRLIEKNTGIPTFFVPTNGMHDYVCGAGEALGAIAERIPEGKTGRRPRSLNILGMTPLDFAPGSAAALKEKIRALGWDVIGCWAMESPMEDLQGAGEAQVNLVVSALGLPAAKALRQRFGTPFAAGIPVDGLEAEIGKALEAAADTGEDQFPCALRPQSGPELTLIGEPVTMGSLAAAISRKHGKAVGLLCPVEAEEMLLAPGDRMVRGEEEIMEALRETKLLVADPFYERICPAGVTLSPLPHQAFSGRNGWKTRRNLFTLEI